VSVTRGGNHAVVVTEEDEAAMVEQLLARFGAQLATDRRTVELHTAYVPLGAFLGTALERSVRTFGVEFRRTAPLNLTCADYRESEEEP
jgi:hypothetical protein